MIKKLYDFRQTAVPAPLLQAEVTREEMDAELALAAARFTDIVAVNGPVESGDVVALEYTDDKGLHRIYANVGKGFEDVEAGIVKWPMSVIRVRHENSDRLVYLAENADPAVTEPLAVLCQTQGIPLTWVKTMAELGKACGIDVGAAAAAVID